MEFINKSNLTISDDKKRLQVEVIHSLLKEAYWSKGIPLDIVKKAIDGSLCFGAYMNDQQVAFARVVTDGATFAWICDVIVDPQFRGKNISKKLIQSVLLHSKLQGLRRICLATKDAHGLYSQFQFKVTENPQNWMEIKNNDIYLKTVK